MVRERHATKGIGRGGRARARAAECASRREPRRLRREGGRAAGRKRLLSLERGKRGGRGGGSGLRLGGKRQPAAPSFAASGGQFKRARGDGKGTPGEVASKGEGGVLGGVCGTRPRVTCAPSLPRQGRLGGAPKTAGAAMGDEDWDTEITDQNSSLGSGGAAAGGLGPAPSFQPTFPKLVGGCGWWRRGG